MSAKRMLEGLRALDLTNELGFLCGKLLADLGVEVIKIEKPGGDPSRKVGPFWHDELDPEKSLYWFAYNADKKGITLDITSGQGREVFLELVKTADFVIESFDPGYLDSLGLGYKDLSAVNKGIIVTSITAFGQTGPYSSFKGTDLVAMGMSGELFLTGDSDRPPVNISLPQAGLHAGSDGAVGSMIAYHHRKKTGEGQQVDVSLQQSAAWFLATTVSYWELAQVMLTRVGTFRSGSVGTIQRQVWPCKDGYIFFFMLGGQQGAKTSRQLVKWMEDEGYRDEFLSTFDWSTYDMATATQELINTISAPIENFFATRTKKEALAAAISRNISICPLLGMKDILNDPHLAFRGFWSQLPYPELNTTIPYPKQYINSSENETAARVRAPRIGQDNDTIYGELGLSMQKLATLKEAGVI